MSIVSIILVILLVVCALCVSIAKDLLASIIIFMTYSLIMSIVWLILQSPDVAITEAAVGAGVTSIMFFVTLRKLHVIDQKVNKGKKPSDNKGEENE